MGTLFKYIFYIVLILAIYIIGKGIYGGQIDEKTTVGEVISDVGTGMKDMASEAIQKTDTEVKDYENAPKKEIGETPANAMDNQGVNQ